ncbi:hypothetical protein GCM10023210_14520 [Chryseobacterium ginsengisoli]|uniref:Organic solvent tolerance-like N-terminal domain-containing protein n=1 Tax=Chryseobacterium ginsengisoli TaxID=363853 RepID=A0ABP9M1A2_9FLAO
MGKNLKVLGVFLLMLCSQSIFSQQKSNDDIFELKGENAKRDLQKKTVIYTGNVSLVSKAFTFENAEKVIVEEATNEVKIYKPKNLKIIHLNALEKTGKKNEEDMIIYNTKTKTLSM